MSFKRFKNNIKDGMYGPWKGVTSVSFWSSGNMGFNKKSMTEFNLTAYKYVVLFYDEKTHTIGVKLSNDLYEEDILTLTHTKTASSIGTRPFLEHFNIRDKVSGKYKVEYDPQDDMLIINI